MNTLMKSMIAVTASMTVSLAFAVDPFTPANALNLQKSAPRNAFTGAFFEINTGLVGNRAKSAASQDTINYTVSFTVPNSPEASVTETGTRSGSASNSGGGVGGQRLILGYGITSGSFNLTPSLFYIPNTFSVGSGIALKNIWGAQLQPGLYIPFNSPNFRGLLLYGTTGYARTDAFISATQSDILCTPEIRRNGLNSGGNAIFYPSNCRSVDSSSNETARFPEGQSSRNKLNGLVLGVGAKLAFSERVYGVFDFTYIIYNKLKDADLHQTMQLNGNGTYAQLTNSQAGFTANYSGTWNRDYSLSGTRLRQSFLFIGAGFRFF